MTRFPIFLLVFTALLTGCDRSKPKVEPEEVKADPSPETAEASAKTHSPEEEEPVEQPEPEKEPEEPVLSVSMKDGEIVIEGAFCDRSQCARIGDQLSRALPEVKVTNLLKAEPHRYPFGWANRVTEDFLIPYFQEIEEPFVGYREGIVTLKGKGDPRLKTLFHRMAGPTFEGGMSRGIDNQITPGKNSPSASKAKSAKRSKGAKKGEL